MRVEPGRLSRRVDQALHDGLREYWSRFARVRSGFDVSECLRESLLLRDGKDCCYDRPGSGVHYAAWYHGTRVNQFIGALDRVSDVLDRDERIRVLDLGAGSGAVAWAIVAHQLLRRGVLQRRNPIRIDMFDSSGPMLDVAKVLWDALVREFAEFDVGSAIEVTWRLEKWPTHDCDGDPIDLLTAHYLFDHSDSSSPDADDAAGMFVREMRHQRVARILCCTTAAKAGSLDALQRALRASDWTAGIERLAPGPLRGPLSEVGRFRRRIVDDVGADIDTECRGLLDRVPSFEGIQKLEAQLLWAKPSALFESTAATGLDLLTPAQRKAVDRTASNVSLNGSPGSGKTLVLSHRLAQFAFEAHLDGGDSVGLFLTFNKKLLEHVNALAARFTRERLRTAGRDVEVRLGKFEGIWILKVAGQDRLKLINWDKGVRRLFKFENPAPWSDEKLETVVPEVLRDPMNGKLVRSMPTRAFPMATESKYSVEGRSLDKAVEFLAAEFRTVYFGRAACVADRYGSVSRDGRGFGLQPAERRACCELLAQIPARFSLCAAQCAAAIGAASPQSRFQSIFVDEAQDFTEVDFDGMKRLLRDGGHWTIAFDPGQSIRTGATFRPPHMGLNWRRLQLSGSYRMPRRLCEALGPISDAIREKLRGDGAKEDLPALRPSPLRISFLGSRPIVIATKDEDEFAEYVSDLVKVFDPEPGESDGPWLAVLEEDEALKDRVRQKLRGAGAFTKATLRSTSVLKVKGMEFPWVVWSTRAASPESIDLQRLCYTILSRCTRHAVIWLKLGAEGKPEPRLAPLFHPSRGLHRDRLMVVDAVTQRAIDDLGALAKAEDVQQPAAP